MQRSGRSLTLLRLALRPRLLLMRTVSVIVSMMWLLIMMVSMMRLAVMPIMRMVPMMRLLIMRMVPMMVSMMRLLIMMMLFMMWLAVIPIVGRTPVGSPASMGVMTL